MAFLKVNRPVEYPLDLKGILPALNRTLDLMNEAEAHLAIAKEQIKYAQFWFLQKMTPLDDIAFNHLLAGNMAGAKEIWSKQESLSSLQNKLVCYLIENRPWLAVKTAEKLYDKFGADYIRKIDANCTLQMTATDLLHQFIDSLGEEIGMQKLLGYELGTETKAYISSQTVGPLINKISAEVEKTKKVDHKDPKARIEAARKLVTNTKEPFSQLKSILPAADSQYQMIADKLGLEILQCGIDYFNNTDDDDAPHTAMKMQKYAQSIVVGTLAKQRCEENVKILQKIIDELPPKEVREEDRAIKAVLNKHIHTADKITIAITMLNSTKLHLQRMKNQLGISDRYYLQLSTQVVALALHKVVAEVNDAQEDPQITYELRMGLGLNSYSIENLRTVLQQAWNATKIMDDFDMQPAFKSHYNQNREALQSICENMSIPTGRTIFSKPNPAPPHPYPYPETDDNSILWIFSIACCIIGLLIGISIGEGWGGLIGAFIGFCLPWKYKEVSER